MKTFLKLFVYNQIGLLVLTVFVVAVVSLLTIMFNTRGQRAYKPGVNATHDEAVNQAVRIFKTSKEQGTDLSSGPCLTNALQPGWVLDVVHNPRQKVDDLPENQCSTYGEGQSKHIVEIDLEGNVVLVK
jgi:hypothetical protein